MTESEFRAAFDAHFETVRRYLARRCHRSDVDDLAAETFTILWRRRSDAPDADRLAPWLIVTARNLLANHHRREQRRRPRVTDSENPAGFDDGDLPAVVTGDTGLDSALAALDATDREILLMDVWDGMTGQAIGAVLGLSENAVHLRLSRTRRRLRELLTDGPSR